MAGPWPCHGVCDATREGSWAPREQMGELGVHLGSEAASWSCAHTSAAVLGVRCALLHTAELSSHSNFPMMNHSPRRS